MTTNHDNPTRARVDSKGNQIWARAPYNFVSPVEQVLEVDQPLSHDRYHDEAQSGWLDCTLETLSPTYVRGMLPQREYKRLAKKQPDELTLEDRNQMAPFYSNGESKMGGWPTPRIPGSTLRGLVHQLVEVLGFGRLRWVAKEPVFSFRAVAAPQNDPLSQPYRQLIGVMAANVCAGYLKRDPRSGHWSIRPARSPKSLHLPESTAYLKVKEYTIGPKDLPGYIRLEDRNYVPQLHQVSVEVQIRKGKTGFYTAITQIGPTGAGYPLKGTLVCSGNMIESRPGSSTKRRSHALVLEPDPTAAEIPVSEQTILDYINGLSPYQQEEVYRAWTGAKGKGQGCLADGKPVFYVVAGSGKEVACFGHSPNFRIPARQRISGVERATTPYDFIPQGGARTGQPDLADVLFGWVEDEGAPQTSKSFAGRVFFSDATMQSVKKGGSGWYQPDPITPHVLSGPKPTTFQHYLVQNSAAGHDPNERRLLAHYGTPTNETSLRGYKFYWPRGSNPPIEASGKELEHPKQLTRIVPVSAGVTFTFRVRFENLRPAELGALCWALALPAGQNPRHHLGMGKPLGMGVVHIRPALTLITRHERYTSLFKPDGRWQEADQPGDMQPYFEAFEQLVCKAVQPGAGTLAEIERIQSLLTMLEWREGTPDWLDWTRYMEIEREPDSRNHYSGKTNEYKERPVLPSPAGVVALARQQLPQGARSGTGGRETAAGSQRGPAQQNQPLGRSNLPAQQAQTPAAQLTPVSLKAGSRVRVKVLDVRTNGVLDLELVDFPEQEDWTGLVKPQDLGAKKYREGDQASLEVVEVLIEKKQVVCRAPAAVGRKHGAVKFFITGSQQEYGFIVPDAGGKDVYVRKSDLAEGVEGLSAGERVTYVESKDMKGRPAAKDVKPE